MSINETVILLTAHPRQQKWWQSVLLSLENYPGPLVLSYDDIDIAMIPAEILKRFDSMVTTGIETGKLGHAKGEIACIKNGLNIINRSWPHYYCLKLGLDEPVWRWRNIQSLIDEIEAERLDCIHNDTRLIFGRAALLNEAFNKYPIEEIGVKPAEAHWRGLIAEFGIKVKRITDYEYWRKLLGLTHLQGEYAANVEKPNKWSWEIGELWPRIKH